MKVKQIISITVLVLLTFISIHLTTNKRSLSGNFTSSDIRKIEAGMDLEDVQAILGQPFSIKSLAGMHNLTCEHPRPRLNQTLTKDADIRAIVDEKFSKTDFCCEGNKEDMAEKRVTLIFTEPMKFSRHYPMLWVHLDGDFKVASVTAKQYDGYLGFDDPVIYSMSAADTFEETRLFEESFD